MKRIKDYTLGEAQEICRARETKGGCEDCVFCNPRKPLLDHCIIGNRYSPCHFDLTDCPRFTPQEVEDAKALMRLFGYSGNSKIKRHGINELWVAGGVDDCVMTRRLENNAFPSVEDGEEYTLGEIIGEEDTNDASN